jgi:hypothetical protein
MTLIPCFQSNILNFYFLFLVYIPNPDPLSYYWVTHTGRTFPGVRGSD